MGKKSDFWTHPQNRRAACLAMAIKHADAVGCCDEAEDVIANADAFGDYIMTGEVPSMDDETATADGVSDPVIGLNIGLDMAGNKPLLATPMAKAAGSVSETEIEKREVEKRLASAQKLGLRLENIEIMDAGPEAEWLYKGPAHLLLLSIVRAAAEDISSRIGKVFDAGFIIRAVHYDADGFPCVSWSPVSAAT